MRFISSKLSLEQKYSYLELMRRIYAANNHMFWYNGGTLAPNSNAKVPNEVIPEKNITSSSSLWVFQELSGNLPVYDPRVLALIEQMRGK